MENFNCVLFDCDGVLVDSEKLVNGTLSDELSLYGLDRPPAEVGRLFVGGTMAGVMQSAQCAVVEDSVTGAKAGVAAGMPVFGYTADSDPAKLAPHCAALFDRMAALPELLGLDSHG